MPARKKPEGYTRLAIAQIEQQDRFTVARNLESMCGLIEQAGDMGCDFFISEEAGISLFCGEAGRIAVPGPETDRVAALARKHGIAVALGVMMKVDDAHCYNAQVMFDRDGAIKGIYRKMLPTNVEILKGVIPADDMPVFDFDFGRVACIICYDMQFPEIPRLAGIRNPDLILFPHVGGAIRGPETGANIAYANTCYVATCGRGCNALADPRGHTVAQGRGGGELLVIDADLTRTLMPTNPGLPLLPWKVHHIQERRPPICRPLLGPSVDIECPALPLYIGNELKPGRQTLAFDLVNRSQARQKGEVTVHLPFPIRFQSDEHVTWYLDRQTGQADWQAAPETIRFDLKPGARTACRVTYTVPDDACGAEAVRIAGTTEGDGPAEEILWQRQLVRLPEPPTLRVPRVKRQKDTATDGAAMALDRQFMGGPAGSKTTLRLAHDGRNLLIHADCRRYGAWRDEAASDRDEIAFPILADPATDRIFWCHLARSGKKRTQRREGGTPVTGREAAWRAAIERTERKWTALIVCPFDQFEEAGGPAEGEARTWRANFMREAVLPERLNSARRMSVVVHPPAARPDTPLSLGAEHACWYPTYARIDAIDRLGTLIFE